MYFLPELDNTGMCNASQMILD